MRAMEIRLQGHWDGEVIDLLSLVRRQQDVCEVDPGSRDAVVQNSVHEVKVGGQVPERGGGLRRRWIRMTVADNLFSDLLDLDHLSLGSVRASTPG